MSKLTEVRDVVVYVPGITGTELWKDGRMLWGATVGAFGRAALHDHVRRALSVTALDDGSLDDLGDGVTAGEVIRAAHILPGLSKAVGPADLRAALFESLDFASPQSPLQAGNYVEFPYDWRRCNRASARKLKAFVEDSLAAWKQQTGYDDARAILIAHSMGGLVSRHYLEVLGGWSHCKALFTLATPHRGSVAIADFIANGYRIPFVDLSDVVKSLQSAYELLAIYPVVERDGRWTRIHETPALSMFDNPRAVAGRAFHDEIRAAVNNTPHVARRVVPYVGYGQPTFQSLHWDGHRVRAGHDVPAAVDASSGDGDGRVPRVSAIPLELADRLAETYAPDSHAGMQQNEFLLGNLAIHIANLQGRGTAHIAGAPEREQRAAIGLNVHDAYVAQQNVTVEITPADDYHEYIMTLRRSGDPAERVERVTLERETPMSLGLLPAGMYSLTVASVRKNPGSPPSVFELFEVVSED